MSRSPFQRGVNLAAGREIATRERGGVSAIFVPITTDLAAPMDDKPRNNMQRIEQTMRNIGAHTAKVKGNIVQIMEDEKQAILREAKEMERAHPESARVPAGITAEEFDIMARNVMAPAIPGRDYNVRDTRLPDFHARGPPETLREDYSRRVMVLVEQAVQQAEGYGKHMEDIQNEYRLALQAEIQRRAGKEAER
ncbi:hypothetical protein VUR80DRAFT_1389 [Thermomyces stellatus]